MAEKTVKDQVHVPFSADEVASLNAYQTSGFFHPFTCGEDNCHGIRLIAATNGWHCASQACDYHQLWAHTFMADWSWNGGVKWGTDDV